MDKGQILDSWKEISAYLGRNVRTCQNWEHALGLPVHRLDGSPKARVFAYTSEIDAWRDEKGHLPGNGEDPKTVTIRRSVRAWITAAMVAGPLLAAAVTMLLVRAPRLPSTRSLSARFGIKLERGLWLDSMRKFMQRPTRTGMALSRDGTFLVYSAIEEAPGPQAKPRLYLRRMDRTEAEPIAGSEGGMSPFLSPDDRWVGFWSPPPETRQDPQQEGRLLKVPVEGGVASVICEASMPFGANWGRDDRVVFSEGDTLSWVPAEGGEPETLTRPDPAREERSHRLPLFLPDGRGVVFTVLRHAWDPKPWLDLLRLDSREWRVLLEDAADARYVPTGHLVFLRQGTLMAVRFDLDALEVRGQPYPLVGNVMQAFSPNSFFNTGAGQFSVSDAGSLVYAAGGIPPPPNQALVWADQRGTEQPVTDLKFPFFAPRLSPDGRKIAYVTMGQEWLIYVYDLAMGTNSRLSVEGAAANPVWSPDGKWLVFPWCRSLVYNLFRLPSDGSAPMERLTTSPNAQHAGSFSPDGKTVAMTEFQPGTRIDLLMLDVGSGRVTTFLGSSFRKMAPEFSPDGRWLAYTSDESKRSEVYVRAFPGPGPKYQVSSAGGREPLWSRDGRQLFFRDRTSTEFWVADIRTEGGLITGKPRMLFKTPGFLYGSGLPIRGYDLSLDSKRFLLTRNEQGPRTPVTELILVQNWFEEIKRLDPAAKK